VWTQLWASFTLPLAWGLSWRAIDRDRGYCAAIVFVSATVALHYTSQAIWRSLRGPTTVVFGYQGHGGYPEFLSARARARRRATCRHDPLAPREPRRLVPFGP
jgi:hypothetical protein